jgi:hypothetical protein
MKSVRRTWLDRIATSIALVIFEMGHAIFEMGHVIFEMGHLIFEMGHAWTAHGARGIWLSMRLSGAVMYLASECGRF